MIQSSIRLSKLPKRFEAHRHLKKGRIKLLVQYRYTRMTVELGIDELCASWQGETQSRSEQTQAQQIETAK